MINCYNFLLSVQNKCKVYKTSQQYNTVTLYTLTYKCVFVLNSYRSKPKRFILFCLCKVGANIILYIIIPFEVFY